ncbi:MAG TPA: hypothetical protein VGK54_17435 [Chloroflexota bacterium]
MAHEHVNGALTSAGLTRDLRERAAEVGGTYWAALLVFGLLAIGGLYALFSLLTANPKPPLPAWGYPAATVAFILSTFQGAPLMAFATRLAKGYWALPLRRASEMGALAGVVNAPLFILLLNQLPTQVNRTSIWYADNGLAGKALGFFPALPGWPIPAPYFWDAFLMLLLTFDGLALLWLSGRVDSAARSGGSSSGPGSGWWGTGKQWNVLSGGVVVLGAFYLMTLVFVHVFVVSDLAISLVPGWRSAIFPPYHAVSGLQAGAATVVLTAGLLRQFGGLRRYIGMDAFWGAAKLMLGTSLLFFYFTWSELITNWYGRTPDELFLLALNMFGPYMPLFIISFCCNFVLPLGLLIWNPIRVSVRGPIVVAAIIFFGNMVDRFRIYVSSWSVAATPVGQHLAVEQVPPFQAPSLFDALIFFGALGAVGVLYLVGFKLLPALSMWEYKTGVLLTIEQAYANTEVRVIAKPR